MREQIKKRFAVNARNWNRFAVLFQAINRFAPYSEHPVLGPFLKRLLKFDRPAKNFTQGYALTINRSLESKYHNMVLPVQIIRNSLMKSSYRALMHKCLCRDGGKCRHFPVDFGCIFIGEGSRITVERGIAREISVETALAHLDRAADLGLVCQTIWVEAEEFVWGVHRKDMHRFLEICFCCPCCCIALRNLKHVGAEIRKRFNSVGWQSVPVKSCSLCGTCAGACPTGAVSIKPEGVFISRDCIGCGICMARCPEGAVEVVRTGETKAHIEDYFWGFSPEV